MKPSDRIWELAERRTFAQDPVEGERVVTPTIWDVLDYLDEQEHRLALIQERLDEFDLEPSGAPG